VSVSLCSSQGQNSHPSLPLSSLPSDLRPGNWHRVRSDVRRPTSSPPTSSVLTLPSLSTQPSDPQSRRLFFPGRPICSFRSLEYWSIHSFKTSSRRSLDCFPGFESLILRSLPPQSASETASAIHSFSRPLCPIADFAEIAFILC
jgi:hypothetical protein